MLATPDQVPILSEQFPAFRIWRDGGIHLTGLLQASGAPWPAGKARMREAEAAAIVSPR